jgi:hypothetical protein
MSQYVNFCYQPELYISRILPECADVNFIGSVINNYGLGHVSSIDLTMTNNVINGQPLYYAIVKFNYWNIDNTIDYRATLMQGKFIKMYYSNYNFWKVSEYKTPQKMALYKMPSIVAGIAPPKMSLYSSRIAPPVPQLKRQACMEYSNFDMFYRKMQVVEHWSNIDKDADVLDFGCKYEEKPAADSDEDEEISEFNWNETDEELLEDILFKKMKAADDAAADKPEFKFHNRHRMFYF